jgi:hypothetical protein
MSATNSRDVNIEDSQKPENSTSDSQQSDDRSRYILVVFCDNSSLDLNVISVWKEPKIRSLLDVAISTVGPVYILG